MKHHQVIFEPEGITIEVPFGISLTEAAGLAGIVLTTPCGGRGTCGKCRVIVKPSNQEVLACRTLVESDLKVFVPTSSRFYSHRILDTGVKAVVTINPSIQKRYRPEFPTDTRQTDKLCEELNLVSNLDTISEMIRNLQNKGNTSQGITFVLASSDQAESSPSNNLLYVEPGDTTTKLYGIAVDLGTTTVVANLFDMNSGTSLAVAALPNAQAKYGADVISRIAHAESSDGYRQLTQSVIGCIQDLIRQTIQKGGIQAEDIYEIVVVGNTAMTHILLSLPVAQLGQAPYEAYTTQSQWVSSGDLGIAIHSAGRLYTPENIAGFIGSDILAAGLAVNIQQEQSPTLLVDIGTNGEVLLAVDGKFYAASCAAGPALEGATIRHGSGAWAGAIERVSIENGDIDILTIESQPPRSICGSGIIDTMAVLVNTGLISSSGQFNTKIPDSVQPSIARRITTHDNQPAFILADTNQTKAEPVLFTQGDVRQVQLSKAAIASGIQLVLKQAGIELTDLNRILIAGAFGNYIRKESSLQIGLLPAVPPERIIYVGNAASVGARMVLLNRESRMQLREIAGRTNYVEIAHSMEFQMVYTENLMFPEPQK